MNSMIGLGQDERSGVALLAVKVQAGNSLMVSLTVTGQTNGSETAFLFVFVNNRYIRFKFI